MNTKQEMTSVLMLPWLAHGHISPFFELAKKLSSRNFHIYFCSTPINLKPIRENSDHNLFSSIELIDLHLPSLPELPPHYHSTKQLPPNLMSTLKTAFDRSQSEFSELLKTLRPNLLIYDFLQPWAALLANEQNIQAVMFTTFGAAASSFLTHYVRNPDEEFPFSEFYFPKDECMKITQFMHNIANGISDEQRIFECMRRSSNMILIKTSREIESKYIDYLSLQAGKEMVSVGLLVQDQGDKDDDREIMDWLRKKERSSVVFVSFGSEYFLSKEEILEIGHGLELSGVNFIWVIRFHGEERVTMNEALPQGFLERMKERGVVVENWAPQAKILKHESIGGFVSHCGWSSTLEGLMFGVPIIAMPMHLDQPLNAKLVVEIGVGLEAKRGNGRLKRENVAKIIQEVVVHEEGENIRRKAKELSEKMKENGDNEINQVVEKLIQLVK